MEDDFTYYREKKNIAAAIKMYKSGQLLDIQSTLFANGKILESYIQLEMILNTID